MPPSSRPDPDALLQDAQKAGRGRLKIFLGAAPGVGKTFAMLEEARAKRRAGIDVVVALIETHGREETAALLGELEILPRRIVEYRGQKLGELDLDALLARRPTLALIDECAHANIPGSRHPKRYQDVMEALAAGIDVTTTLNIQHIESLNDVVARITGVSVRETIPDAVLNRADEIELIDLPPEELIKRMRAGKIYLADQADRALENFFTKGNLTALRELALRTAASRVDDDMVAWMRSHAVEGPWPAQERLLVCINEAPIAKTLVRTAKRMADRAKIPWIAVTVITPRHEAMGGEKTILRREVLKLAESLGGEAITLRAESNVAGEVLTFARRRNVTRLVIGRPRRRGLRDFWREPVSERLLDAGHDFEVTVVAGEAKPERPPLATRPWPAPPWRPYAAGLLAAALATLVSLPLSYWGGGAVVGSLSVVYLVGVLSVGMRYGLWPSLAASLVAFLAYNFFFTEPYYTFEVTSGSELAALFVFLLGAAFTGSLAGRLKGQVESLRISQRRTEQLYDFARKIASASRLDDVLWAAAAHIAATLNCRSIILMPDPENRLVQLQGFPAIEEDLDAKSETAARWAFDKGEAAGANTATLPAADWLFVPLTTGKAALGVIGVLFHDPGKLSDPEAMRLLLAVEDQVAMAIERFKLAEELEATRINAEGEKLRTALLASISHDLRTPLVTIIGGLTAITDDGSPLPAASRQALSLEALDEAHRLDRYVQNLLNMTQLGYGALSLRRSAIDLREIIGRVRADLARILAGYNLIVDVPRDLPKIDGDPVLIVQALTNIVENAGKYAPTGTEIRIAARAVGSRILISVTDDGPGIPPADRERVFDLFYRVAKGDGQPAGTGLGLAIVKGLVEAHGGQVRALSGPGDKGTRIEIDLPALIAAGAMAVAP